MEQYLNLLREIKAKGTYKPAARENMPGTQSLFGFQFRHDLSKGFPLLTTKKMFFKGVVIELLWFLRGDTNIKFLVENGVNIWNEDAYQYYKKKCKQYNFEPYMDFETFVNNLKSFEIKEPSCPVAFQGDPYKLGDCGFQYGKVWRKWKGEYNTTLTATERIDQITNVINSLKNSPESRRHIVTAIDPAHETDLALYWCHAMFQFNCRPLTYEERTDWTFKNKKDSYTVYGDIHNEDAKKRGKHRHEWLTWFDEIGVPKYYLDCQLYQRSADVFLGVPFNIASYALLTELLAKICNMIPGEFIHTFGDVHIYDNHKEAVDEQLTREPMKLPKLHVLERHKDHGTHPDHFEKYLVERINLDEFLGSLTRHDFRLEQYNFHPEIKAELSTGLKK